MSIGTWQGHVDFMVSRGNIEQLMIVSADDGALWASSDANSFYLREYTATITQEDGTEKDETVNEANNIVKLMKGQSVSHGLRINGTKKQQITRNFKDDQTQLQVIYGKFPMGGSCVANAGKCIIIATFNEGKGHTSPPCNETVQEMANYLLKSTWPAKMVKSDLFAGATDSSNTIPKPEGPATWQQYLDLLLVEKGNIAEAMLIEVSNGRVLAATANFQLKKYEAEIAQEDGTDQMQLVDESKNLLQLMRGTKSPQGLRLNSTKFQVVRQFKDETSECQTVNGKKTMGGCSIASSGKIIVLGTFDEKKGHSAPGCCAVVADLAGYLRKNVS